MKYFRHCTIYKLSKLMSVGLPANRKSLIRKPFYPTGKAILEDGMIGVAEKGVGAENGIIENSPIDSQCL